MRYLKFVFQVFFLQILISCGSDERSYPPGLPNGPTLSTMSGVNVLPITVNGSQCSGNSYVNKPCVSVQICTPGTTSCQTINDILLDTGSVGLRVFRSLLTITPTQQTSAGREVAECIRFGDGSKIWGPVQAVHLVLGGESAVQVPMHVIDSSYMGEVTHCQNSKQSPTVAQYNGILGVGPLSTDCGVSCVGATDNGKYFTCLGGSCIGAAFDPSEQVVNPVAALSNDNNGILIKFPAVPFGGLSLLEGYLVLGIGTRDNNVASGVSPLDVHSSSGEFTTHYDNQSLTSVLDTGSNVYVFPRGSISACESPSTGYHCSSTSLNLSSTAIASSGSPELSILFSVGHYTNLINSGNKVFIEASGHSTSRFNYGLPFFMGRNVYIGFQDKTSSLGAGPLVAF